MRPHKLSAVTSSFIGAIQQIFLNGNALTLYDQDISRCVVTVDEDRLPCATSGVTKYAGPPCGDGNLTIIIFNKSVCIYYLCLGMYENKTCIIYECEWI